MTGAGAIFCFSGAAGFGMMCLYARALCFH